MDWATNVPIHRHGWWVQLDANLVPLASVTSPFLAQLFGTREVGPTKCCCFSCYLNVGGSPFYLVRVMDTHVLAVTLQLGQAGAVTRGCPFSAFSLQWTFLRWGGLRSSVNQIISEAFFTWPIVLFAGLPSRRTSISHEDGLHFISFHTPSPPFSCVLFLSVCYWLGSMKVLAVSATPTTGYLPYK